MCPAGPERAGGQAGSTSRARPRGLSRALGPGGSKGKAAAPLCSFLVLVLHPSTRISS